MARRTVTVDSLAYEFAADDPPPIADRVWSLVQGRAIDEITGEPVAPIRVAVSEPGLAVNTGGGGTYTVFGRPWHRFPPLAAPNYPLHVTIEADRYLAFTQVITVPTYQRTVAAPAPAIGATVLTLNSSIGLFSGQLLLIGPAGPDQESLTIANSGPGANQVTLAAPLAKAHPVGAAVAADEFVPVAVPDALMHRLPVVVRGRAVQRNATGIGTTPVANASIAVQGLWRTARDVSQHLPAVAANVVSLAPGLYEARPVGASLAAQNLPAVAGDDKLLVAAASSGDTFVDISDRQNLVAPPAPPPYSVLRIDADQPREAEHVAITAMAGFGAPDEPGRISLAHALSASHRGGARVQRVAPQPPAAPTALSDAGVPGDPCVFVNDVAGLSAADTVAISGGPGLPEFQQVRMFAATSDAAGYFQLPPLSRVAQITLSGTAAALAPVTIDFQPDYTQSANWVDVVFS
jgi:hypothetical protein